MLSVEALKVTHHYLQVFKYTERGYTLLQNLTEAQADDWVESSIPLANDGPFKLEFEGIRGPEYEGDIALDDIEVCPSHCFLHIFQG